MTLMGAVNCLLSLPSAVEIEHSDLEFIKREGEDEAGTTQWKGRWKSRHLVVSIYRGRKLCAEEVCGVWEVCVWGGVCEEVCVRRCVWGGVCVGRCV